MKTLVEKFEELFLKVTNSSDSLDQYELGYLYKFEL